jgi:hypothetical protein
MGGKDAMFSCKEHKADGRTIIAVCDAKLLGRKIKFNNVDFEVSESFYGGIGADGEKVLEIVGKADMVNVVGKDIVDLLVRHKLVDEQCVLWMGDVPHVQIIRI